MQGGFLLHRRQGLEIPNWHKCGILIGGKSFVSYICICCCTICCNSIVAARYFVWWEKTCSLLLFFFAIQKSKIGRRSITNQIFSFMWTRSFGFPFLGLVCKSTWSVVVDVASYHQVIVIFNTYSPSLSLWTSGRCCCLLLNPMIVWSSPVWVVAVSGQGTATLQI